MKKIITLFMTLFCFINLNGQTFRSIKSEINIPDNTKFVIETDNNIKTEYIIIMYQNAKYSHITDLGFIFIRDSIQLSDFIKNLEKMVSYMENPPNTEYIDMSDIPLQGKYKYTLHLNLKYNFGMALCNQEDKYCYLKLNKLKKLIEWLKLQKFKEKS